MTAAHLSVREISKCYGALPVLADISFDIPHGEIAALIGPNGAGKSTLFGILGGALAADTGSVLLNGDPLLGRGPESVARRGVGRTFQTSAPYRSLSVRENLLLVDQSRGRFWQRVSHPLHGSGHGKVQAALTEVGLAHLADAPCAALSHGDGKRLELAMALTHDPTLLLMDEPTAGMAPAERLAFMDLVRTRSQQRGMTVLFTEHDMATVFGFAQRILVLDRGHLIADAAPEAVRDDPVVRRAYLGNGGITTEPMKPL